jgi:hypothetical protein
LKNPARVSIIAVEFQLAMTNAVEASMQTDAYIYQPLPYADHFSQIVDALKVSLTKQQVWKWVKGSRAGAQLAILEDH